ncbi:MAG TPA: Wzz/FepE/Etk N-terminal domain-containing protein [Verrucomicrobiae bacterium]|nr:Wzz/FepE/Etk N-terminal domain-containing protein [Verrucomicrobiae bacterium]
MRFADANFDRPLTAPTLRDLLAVVFRQKWIVLISFFGVLLGIICSGWLTPRYPSRMEILVRRERSEPLVSSELNLVQTNPHEISEEELNSEVELLNSEDLLRKVVLATGLQDTKHFSVGPLGRTTSEEDIARATEGLRSRLTVQPLRKTNVISVEFDAADPETAARVLKSLAGFYVEKHLEVHRPAGEFKFFDQQTERYRTGLKEAEVRLKGFIRERGVVSPDQERDLAIQKMAEFKAAYLQTQSQIAETEQRIRNLEEQDASVPPRQITQVRTSENAQLMEQMKSTLLTLDLKRTELLTKFDSNYRPVQEIDKQIADTRAAIAKEENAPIREETIDQNPTHEWVKEELSKAQTDLAGLKAKAAADEASLRKYRENAGELQDASIAQQELLRATKTQEENYLLYLQKEEQARINDALDQRGILNVAVAEQPTVPAFPVRSTLSYGLLSIFLAGAGSLGLALISDFFSPSFRTPSEVIAYLGGPVLASIPRENQLQG